jgi:hypothetical protein
MCQITYGRTPAEKFENPCFRLFIIYSKLHALVSMVTSPKFISFNLIDFIYPPYILYTSNQQCL